MEATYGGSRGYDLEMTGIPVNIPSLANRQTCNLLEGGVSATSGPNYCNAQIPNPFRSLAPFSGTSLFTASTVQRYQLMRPFPQFTGDISQGGDNHGRTWFNSLQVNYKYRLKGGLNLITNYTFSKWTQRLGYADPFAKVFQQGIAQADEPHTFKLIAIYQIPIGRGKMFLGSPAGFSGKLADKLIGGWEVTDSFNYHSGEPAGLPGNALMLKNPALSNVDWHAYQPRLWSNCVIQLNNDGSRTLLNQGTCGTDASTYSWLALPAYAPNPNPAYSGQMRMRGSVSMDASVNKTVNFTEHIRGQIRIEAFNALNHFTWGDATVNTTASSPNFGSILPNTLGNSASFPRQIQLGFKLLW